MSWRDNTRDIICSPSNFMLYLLLTDKKREATKSKVSAWDGLIVEESPESSPVNDQTPSRSDRAAVKKKWDGSFSKCAMDDV